MISRRVRPSQDPLIFNNLQLLSFGVLENYKDDLFVHDRQILKKNVEPGTSWLWIVHKNGTHLARWDEDAYAGSTSSHVECLVRSLVRGDWSNNSIHIFHVIEIKDDGAHGWVTGRLDIDDIARALPRPLPQPKLPGEKIEQQVYSAHTGLVQALQPASVA
jgi:hypothetical protein